MSEMLIDPGEGIGPICLGMTHAEVCVALGGTEIKGQGSSQYIPSLGLKVEYSDWDGVVTFVEAHSGSGAKFDSIYVFEVPAEEVVAAIVKSAGLTMADFPPKRHTYLIEDLRLVLWRSAVADDEQDEDDEDGRFFQTVSVYGPEYYSEEILRFMREQTKGKSLG